MVDVTRLARAVKVARLIASGVSAEEAPKDQYGIVPAPPSRSRRNAVPGEAHQMAQLRAGARLPCAVRTVDFSTCWRSEREEDLGPDA
jgi:hypothetical protein